MINKEDFNMLLHDIKRISRAVKLIRDEKDEEKRHIIADLLADEVDRLYEDLEETKNKDEMLDK